MGNVGVEEYENVPRLVNGMIARAETPGGVTTVVSTVAVRVAVILRAGRKTKVHKMSY